MKLYWAAGCEKSARRLADRHGFAPAGGRRDIASLNEGYILYFDDRGLSLCQTGWGAAGPIRCDFAAGGARHRRLYGGGKSQTIARAVGIRDNVRPAIADLTAGLGGDAVVLASLGCRVSLVERHPVAAALLEDGLRRAGAAIPDDPSLAPVVDRMRLIRDDAGHWLRSLNTEDSPDVIYLDPMFPERKKSALVKKEMRAFQQVVGDDPDADQLLPLALARARHRVVVKRPAQAPWLNKREPGHTLKGKSVRFDIYPLKGFNRCQ